MSPIPKATRISYARYCLFIRTIRAIVGIVILAVIGLVAAASTQAAFDTTSTPATVTLHEQAAVGQGKIYLGQIGEIAAVKEVADQLAEIEIGPSPLAGREREIKAGYVRMRIARAGFGRDAVYLAGASSVVVRHPAPVQTTTASSAGTTVLTTTRPQCAPGTATDEPSAPPPVIVKRGSNLRITVLSGDVTVTTVGQLLDDAAIGELATARVKTTSRKVCGVLSSPRDLTVTL